MYGKKLNEVLCIFNVLSGTSTYLSRLLMLAHILPIRFQHGTQGRTTYTGRRCDCVVYYYINKHLMGKVNDDRTQNISGIVNCVISSEQNAEQKEQGVNNYKPLDLLLYSVSSIGTLYQKLNLDKIIVDLVKILYYVIVYVGCAGTYSRTRQGLNQETFKRRWP